MKVQDTLVNKDEGVNLLNYKKERKSRELRKHFSFIYSLLLLSFGLHLYVIITGGYFNYSSESEGINLWSEKNLTNKKIELDLISKEFF